MPKATLLKTPKSAIGTLLVIFALLSACNGAVSAAPASAIEIASLAQPEPETNNSVDDAETEDSSAAGNSADGENAEIADADESENQAQQARVVPEFSLGNPQMKSSEAGVFDRYSGEIQVLEFFAYWCPNCKALAPRIHGLEEAYSGEIEFTFLDIDDPANQALKEEFGFYYQPFVLIIDGAGNVQKTWVGGGIDPFAVQAEIERLIEMDG